MWAGPSIEGVCLGGRGSGLLAKGAWIKPTKSEPEHSKTIATIACVNDLAYGVSIHSNCACNQYIALTNRHLIARGKHFDLPYFKLWFTQYKPVFDVKPYSPLEFCKHYRGAKKRMYITACETLHDWSPSIKMFVKVERHPQGSIQDKDPRAIQFRGRQYNICLGRHLRAIEDHYYKHPSVAKELNQLQRATRLREMWKEFTNPMVVLLDHSRFDASMNKYHLRAEHKWYKSMFPHLHNLLRCQERNYGRSSAWKYHVIATRMSGDYNTALGTTYINHNIIQSWLEVSQVKGEFLIDGDDSVVIVEKRDVHRLNFDHFKLMGLKTKSSFVDKFSEIEFCQSRPVKTVKGWVMVRNPQRVISNMQLCLRQYRGVASLRWLKAVCEAEFSNAVGVPFLQPFFLDMLGRLKQYKSLHTEDTWRRLSYGYGNKAAVITTEAEDTFNEAWGPQPPRPAIVIISKINDVASYVEQPIRLHTLDPVPDGGWAYGGQYGPSILESTSCTTSSRDACFEKRQFSAKPKRCQGGTWKKKGWWP